jgi:hypothetical protein
VQIRNTIDYGLDCLVFETEVWARDFSPLRHVQTGSGGPPTLVFN